jgi:hypothetical protein
MRDPYRDESKRHRRRERSTTMKHTSMRQEVTPLKHGTRVAAVMTATALMMTAAVSGLTLIESRTQATTMAADTVIAATAPASDLPASADLSTVNLAAADVQYTASDVPKLPSLAGLAATTKPGGSVATNGSTAATRPAARSSQSTAQTTTRVSEPDAQPSDDHASDDHASDGHAEQDD